MSGGGWPGCSKRGAYAVALLALSAIAVSRSSAAVVLRPPCVVSGNTCTVRIPLTAAVNNSSVVVTTPRPNHGALITDNNHKPDTAMYNVDENHHGITFQLMDTTSQYPGTVLIIVFQLDPVGSTSTSSTATSAGGSSSTGTGTLSLSGPTVTKLGSTFSYKVSADLAAPALFLAFNPAGSTCASTASSYARSSARVHQTVPAGSLTFTFNLVAEPAGSFALCVYAVNPSTGATEAHAAAHWTNG